MGLSLGRGPTGPDRRSVWTKRGRRVHCLACCSGSRSCWRPAACEAGGVKLAVGLVTRSSLFPSNVVATLHTSVAACVPDTNTSSHKAPYSQRVFLFAATRYPLTSFLPPTVPSICPPCMPAYTHVCHPQAVAAQRAPQASSKQHGAPSRVHLAHAHSGKSVPLRM